METESYNSLNSLGSYATLVHDEILRAKTGYITVDIYGLLEKGHKKIKTVQWRLLAEIIALSTSKKRQVLHSEVMLF